MADKSNKKGADEVNTSDNQSTVKDSKIAKFSYRKEEQASGLYDRSGRFFCRKGSWFFKTREGIDYGPYQSRVECRYAYDEFIEVVSGSSSLGDGSGGYHNDQSDWELPKISFN